MNTICCPWSHASQLTPSSFGRTSNTTYEWLQKLFWAIGTWDFMLGSQCGHQLEGQLEMVWACGWMAGSGFNKVRDTSNQNSSQLPSALDCATQIQSEHSRTLAICKKSAMSIKAWLKSFFLPSFLPLHSYPSVHFPFSKLDLCVIGCSSVLWYTYTALLHLPCLFLALCGPCQHIASSHTTVSCYLSAMGSFSELIISLSIV